MGATVTLNSRIDAQEKEQFVSLANAIGITPSAAINIFVHKFNDVGGFPFDVRVSAEPLRTEAEALDTIDALSADMIDHAW